MNDAAPPGPWMCPTCQRDNSALAYCPACGEHRPDPDHLSLRGLAEQALESMFHADGRILRTVRTLLLQPGRLTSAWMHGEHRRWMAPFQLFLFLNVVFFLSETLSGLSVLAVPFDTHVQHMQYSPWALGLADSYLRQHGGTLGSLRPQFEARQTTNAKVLVLAMVPLFALALQLLFPLRRRLGAMHLVFALHFYAYLLMCLTLLFPIIKAVVLLLHRLHLTLDPALLDYVVSSIELTLIVLYLWPAIARVYSLRMPRLMLSVVFLSVSVLPILIVYRLFLFWVTLKEL